MSVGEDGGSPFRRPRFITAAAVIAVIAILGIVLGVVNATRDEDPDPAPVPAPPAAAAATPDGEDEDTDSVCGLEGAVTDPARLTSAPPVDRWDYQGTTAYPVSVEYGPGAVDPAGFRYCFQHSPEGALFAAANAAVQGTDPETVGPWLKYVLAEGPHRATLLAARQEVTDDTGVRINIAGFRVLAYQGDTARVDIAIRGTTQGQIVDLSMVYDLVWDNGDWKLEVTDPDNPVDAARLPSLSGYISWGG